MHGLFCFDAAFYQLHTAYFSIICCEGGGGGGGTGTCSMVHVWCGGIIKSILKQMGVTLITNYVYCNKY